LTGTVADRRSKRLMEDIAEDMLGVIDVHNQIKIQREGQASTRSQSTNRDLGSSTASTSSTSSSSSKTPRA
jgi:hypothetical protein